ncbi:MAG: hypothetical protein EP299_01835 [Acidobacteria bacterium]|nr:MAG: hypothetical protein EP299_01835 [Acidobacteriota bacterium]
MLRKRSQPSERPPLRPTGPRPPRSLQRLPRGPRPSRRPKPPSPGGGLPSPSPRLRKRTDSPARLGRRPLVISPRRSWRRSSPNPRDRP